MNLVFDSADASAVKSIRQRALLNVWLRLSAKAGGTPARQDFQPERMDDEQADLIEHEIVDDNGATRFMIGRKGQHITDAFGSSGEGRYLDQFLGATLSQATIPVYLKTAEVQRPTYTVAMVSDLYGRDVAYERLLLPFATAGRPTSILASLKTISDDGAFELRNLMRASDVPMSYKICAVIDRDVAARAPGLIDEGDVIEFG